MARWRRPLADGSTTQKTARGFEVERCFFVNFADIVALIVILACVAAAIAYIVREKRRGVMCVGCASSATCAQKAKAGADGCGCGAADRMVADMEERLRK